MGAWMAIHKGFDKAVHNGCNNNIWERKQDHLCKLNFAVWSYLSLFHPVLILVGGSIIYPKENWLVCDQTFFDS